MGGGQVGRCSAVRWGACGCAGGTRSRVPCAGTGVCAGLPRPSPRPPRRAARTTLVPRLTERWLAWDCRAGPPLVLALEASPRPPLFARAITSKGL